MSDFIFHFLFCNFALVIVIVCLLAVKRLFRNHMTCRAQYVLWFPLSGLLAVPFFPSSFHLTVQKIFRAGFWKSVVPSGISPVLDSASASAAPVSGNWMDDLTLSVSQHSPLAGLILFGIWVTGMAVLFFFFLNSVRSLFAILKTALPLQNDKVLLLYHQCLNEVAVSRKIPIYSTAFLSSPMITGLLFPQIYLPISLISDGNFSEIRYILLHELQHYRHKDVLCSYLINLIRILYWFNPFVLYALREMQNDRETACDTSVLQILKEEEYPEYGNTLIRFAEKLSRNPFVFGARISSTIRQLKKRILNIASYQKPSVHKTIKSSFFLIGITILLFSAVPFLSTYAADDDQFHWDHAGSHISYPDLSSCFGEYDGCFVLYEPDTDTWEIYRPEQATQRKSPDSTYKIYDALIGLEEEIITPEDSRMTWDQTVYPFEAWNTDQDLQSALTASVNWYFQSVDAQIGTDVISDYLCEMEYGNQKISDISSYWLESSLKISPIEQVLLLEKFYDNAFGFDPGNIRAVKNAICLSSSEHGRLYGKTGTGRVNGNDVNGWFVGYVEDSGHPCFFAVNISARDNASGSVASEIALSILSDRGIW